jgi:glutaminyl-tRNA synthetase
VTPDALRDFAEMIGVAKNNSVVDIGKLEFAIRNDLERRAPRALAVLNPLPITIESWPAGQVEELDVPWWPGEPERGGRKVPFGRDLIVERDDVAEDPPADWRRLAPGREIRLAGAYVVRCEEVVRDAAGEISSVRCTHDPRSIDPAAERRRVSGTVHWVHATRSVPAEVRLYDRLFRVEQPDAEGDFLQALNPDSLVRAEGARVEPALASAEPGTRWQFLRQGYFFADPEETRPGAPVFNRTITLKDSWATRAAPRVEARARARKPAPAEPLPVAPQRSRGDTRATLHAANPEAASRFRRFHGDLSLGESEADLLSGDAATAAFFEAALEAHANAPSLARWLLNDLAGLTKDTTLEAIPLEPDAFGRFVALVDEGRLTPSAGKALLAELVARGGEPAARMKALGLEKVEDRGALLAAIDSSLAAHSREVERYRAGEKKLFGALLGAVMRATQGAAEPALVRQLLQERLG